MLIMCDLTQFIQNMIFSTCDEYKKLLVRQFYILLFCFVFVLTFQTLVYILHL